MRTLTGLHHLKVGRWLVEEAESRAPWYLIIFVKLRKKKQIFEPKILEKLAKISSYFQLLANFLTLLPRTDCPEIEFGGCFHKSWRCIANSNYRSYFTYWVSVQNQYLIWRLVILLSRLSRNVVLSFAFEIFGYSSPRPMRILAFFNFEFLGTSEFPNFGNP